MKIKPAHRHTPSTDVWDKLLTLPLPTNLLGKTVLDVACYTGDLVFESAYRGANRAVGLDKVPVLCDEKHVNLIAFNKLYASGNPIFDQCEFYELDVGMEFPLQFGQFDIVIINSVYARILHNCNGKHKRIWKWLDKITNEVVFIDKFDMPSKLLIDTKYHERFNSNSVIQSAKQFFECKLIDKNRGIYQFTKDSSCAK